MKTLFSKHGIILTENQEKQFVKLLELFQDWNSKINLSALREESDIIEKHFLDSVLATKFFNFQGKNILDLGAGGGFPTLPLAIMTDSKIIALDSVAKKMDAVQNMADALKLKVNTLHGRAEDFGQKSMYREQFDWVVTRAVAPWPVLLELVLPFVKVGGSFIAFQGPQIVEDLKTFKNLEKEFGGRFEKIIQDKLNDAERFFVQIKKVSVCPKTFPRKAGEVRKNPWQ